MEPDEQTKLKQECIIEEILKKGYDGEEFAKYLFGMKEGG